MSKSTLQTAIAVANSMVGTSLLVLPVNYLEKGIIQNSIGAVIMCFIMGATAVMIGTLVGGRIKEFFQVVKIQLGIRWSQIMAVIGALLTTLVGCIVFLLTTDIIYEVFQSFSETISNMGPKLCKCILIIPFIPFCFLNSLDLVVKFGPISMVLIWLYILTIFYSFIENIPNIDSGVLKQKELTFSNLQYWLAVQGFSFVCHPTLDAVIKSNKNGKTNGKAVALGYLFSFVIMVSCGVIGALALYKKDKKKEDDNIIDYFIGHWQYYLLGVSMFIYLFSIFPIFPFVTRMQIFSILPEKFKQNANKTQRNIKFGFVALFMVLTVLFILFETSPAVMMGFLVTVICFYICYLLPSLIKLKRLSPQQQQKSSIKSLLSQSNSQSISNYKQISENESAPQNQSGELSYQSQFSSDKNKKIKKIGYITLLIFGCLLMLAEIWTIVSGWIQA